MDPLKILIVDDEPLARLRLRSLLSAIGEPASTVVGEAASADEALARLREQPADLLLLDVRMPGQSGVAFATALRRAVPAPAVVFVSAFPEHAIDAFDLDAVDYLTKPVRQERLQAALQRVLQRLYPVSTTTAMALDEPVLVVHDRGRLVRVPVAEVLYLKAELKYVTLRTAEHEYLLDDALADLEQRLGEGFVRVHRNALVARRAVRALERRGAEGSDEGWAVRVAPADEWLAVSRRQLATVREALAR
jgi:two-component system, LytTR family, response regulator AlgR